MFPCSDVLAFTRVGEFGGEEMSLETIFDIIQTPIFGAIIGAVLYFQLRRQDLKHAGLWAIVAGAIGAIAYAAIKFFF